MYKSTRFWFSSKGAFSTNWGTLATSDLGSFFIVIDSSMYDAQNKA
jgi:hypothetical protein